MQHRYSTRFAVMSQNKLHVFGCPFFRTFTNRNNEQQTTIIGKAWSRGTWCLLLAVNGILNSNTVIALNGLFDV